MQLARVIDQVISTTRHPTIAGCRLLLVQAVDLDRTTLLARPPLVAVDCVGAGPGELVLTCEEGRAARQIIGTECPVRTLILGLVDEPEPGREPT